MKKTIFAFLMMCSVMTLFSFKAPTSVETVVPLSWGTLCAGDGSNLSITATWSFPPSSNGYYLLILDLDTGAILYNGSYGSNTKIFPAEKNHTYYIEVNNGVDESLEYVTPSPCGNEN